MCLQCCSFSPLIASAGTENGLGLSTLLHDAPILFLQGARNERVRASRVRHAAFRKQQSVVNADGETPQQQQPPTSRAAYDTKQGLQARSGRWFPTGRQ